MKEARSPKPDSGVEGRDRRTAATACGWCGGPITPGSRGVDPEVVLGNLPAPRLGAGRSRGLGPVRGGAHRAARRVPGSPHAHPPRLAQAARRARRTAERTGGSTTATCQPWGGHYSPYWRPTGDGPTSPAPSTRAEPDAPGLLQLAGGRRSRPCSRPGTSPGVRKPPCGPGGSLLRCGVRTCGRQPRVRRPPRTGGRR
jgi:hypothetical protein